MRGRLLETVAWWPLLVGVWVLTLSSVSVSELAFAAAAALPCAALATAARRAIRGSWRADLGWLRWLPALVGALAADTARVLALGLRHARSRQLPAGLSTVELGSSPAGRRSGHAALAALTLSATPGSIVVDDDASDRQPELTVHVVGGGRAGQGRSGLAEAVRR